MSEEKMLEVLDEIWELIPSVCGNCIIENEEADDMQMAIYTIQKKDMKC